MKKNIKKLISILVCVVLCVSLSSSAFALSGQRIAAGIASAIMAGNITITSTMSAIGNRLNLLVDPMNRIESTYDNFGDYMDRSVVKIRRGVDIIDGVSYDEVWLSADAANKFRVDALDFISAYNIASNSEATYASGVGFVDNLPVYDTGGQFTTVSYSVPAISGQYSISDHQYVNVGTVSNSVPYTYRVNNQNVLNSSTYQRYYPITFRNIVSNGDVYLTGSRNDGSSLITTPVKLSLSFLDSPFDFDYTSGLINADPIEDGYGYSYRVPSSVVNNYYYDTYGDDETHWGDFAPGFNIDINTPAGLAAAAFIADIITRAIEMLVDGDDSNITINVAPSEDPDPIPAPVPDPEDIPDAGEDPGSPQDDDPISATDFHWLDNLLRWIRSTIDSFRVAVQNQLLNIQESINAIKSAFDTAIQNILDFFQDILDGIHNIYDIIADFLQDILDAIQNIDQLLQDLFDNILDAIEQGPVKLWRSALNVLKTVFAPILATLKTFVGLWHYVVEWVGVILNPFLWFFNLMSGTSYNMVLPIYAGLAGFIVIAIYKRFGR